MNEIVGENEKTFDLAPDEVLALYHILYSIVQSELVYEGVILSMRDTAFDVKICGVHEG